MKQLSRNKCRISVLASLWTASFLSSFLYAKSGEIGSKTWDGRVIIERPNIAYADSSKVEREGKTVFALLGGGLIAGELVGGYHLNPDLFADLRVVRQEDAVDDRSILFAASLGYFAANSLYIRSGLGYRIGSAFNYRNFFLEDREQKSATNDFGIEIALGNHWQWESLLLGAEWFAIYLPVLSTRSDIDFQLRALMFHVGIAI